MTNSIAAGTLRRISGTLSAFLLLTVSAAACYSPAEPDTDQSQAELCSSAYEWRVCDQDIDPNMDGVQVCVEGEDHLEWTECQPHHFDKGPEDCNEGSTWDGQCCQTEYHCCESDPVCMTPLVLSFDQRPVTFAASDASFDLTREGLSVATDWPAADTPWLALDRNGNGRIDDGGELFGSATTLGAATTTGGDLFARNGFAALAEADDNGDGFITADDAVWSQLKVWSDHDANRVSSAAELSSVDSHQLIAIELDYRTARRCDARGNCEAERSRFWFRNASGQQQSGTVIDVHLAAQ